MKRLQAGPITALYESGFLRRISYGDTEVLRMIYFALRDHNWNTMHAEIRNEKISIKDDYFEISYDCLHRNGDVMLMEWKCITSGKSDGTIILRSGASLAKISKKTAQGFVCCIP